MRMAPVRVVGVAGGVSRHPASDGHCELRNLSGWCRPAAPAFSHNILPAFEDNWKIYFLSSVNRSSWYPWPTLARSEPTRMASAGGQLRALNRLRAEACDLAIGIDAGEIDGPGRSVFDRGIAGAFRSKSRR